MALRNPRGIRRDDAAESDATPRGDADTGAATRPDPTPSKKTPTPNPSPASGGGEQAIHG